MSRQAHYKVVSHEEDKIFGSGSFDMTRRKSLSAAFCFAKRHSRWPAVNCVKIVDTRNGRVWPVYKKERE